MKRTLTYSNMDVLLASPDKPMPEASRRHQLLRMHMGLLMLETAPDPELDDWVVVSDAVNMLETLLNMGHVQDPDDLLGDAVAVMAEAGERKQAGKTLRLSGRGIQVIRGVLEDYTTALNTLSERTMKAAHRKTEKRLHDILDGKLQPHDVRFV